MQQDGGGIRGYSSLLILNELMSKIRELEQQWPDDGAQVQSSGDYPWRENVSSDSDSTDSSNQFYPCHYFDYMAGTSTGG
jgi:patatin-like phospholipase/acyl hydrolase